ncbi:hypothetical protein DQ04_23201000, partial [Trypanosoma grayi]|uniref:hypothetical protein n=1 Tax=Trypanosoma grayi TaxID=71804 RepID=UPI0004F4234B
AAGDVKITLTGTVDATTCTPSPPLSTGKSSEVTISTAVTLKKKGSSEEEKTIPNEVSKVVTVPDGYKLTLDTSLEVKCMKKETTQETPETLCTANEDATATYTLTYGAAVKSTTSGKTTVNPPETQTRDVTVPAGHNVKLIAKIVATCAAVTKAEKPSPPVGDIAPSGGQEKSLDGKNPDPTHIAPESQISEHNPTKPETDKQMTQGGETSKQSNTPLRGPSTGDLKSTGQGDAGEKSSALTNEVLTPVSSESESKERESSVTVNGADHTASTATSQSETTTEGAPNTDADAPT